MPQFDTFEAWVSVNGAKLDEYDVQEKVEANGTRVISCWIPSQTEQEFIIHAYESRVRSRPPLESVYWVDGIRAGSRVWTTRCKAHVPLDSIPTPDGMRHLRFSSLNLTDDESVLDSGNGLSGEVSVEFQHVEYTPRNSKPLLVKLSSGIVHERLKKGGGHAVQPGSTAAPAGLKAMDATPIGDPIVKFVFHYRPLELLRAHMIAPPSPVIPALVLPRQRQRKLKEVKPAISVKNDEDVDINIEDVEAREAAIRYHEAQLNTLKRKRPDVKPMKTESPTQRRRISSSRETIEFINLTLDD